MALYSVSLKGIPGPGEFVTALVVAPSKSAALKAVDHLTKPDAAYEAVRISTTRPQLLDSHFNDEVTG